MPARSDNPAKHDKTDGTSDSFRDGVLAYFGFDIAKFRHGDIYLLHKSNGFSECTSLSIAVGRGSQIDRLFL